MINDVTVIGSLNLDLVATAPRLPSPGETVLGTAYDEFAGGKGLNQAVAASRAGARTALVGAVGGDPPGDGLVELARSAGVDTTHVERRVDQPTGRALITVDLAGENSIVVIPGANSTVTGADVPPARVVLAQLEVPISAVVETFARVRASGSVTILNPAPAAALPAELLELTDVIVPNQHELDALGDLDGLLRAGVTSVIVTRGAHGVTAATRNRTTGADRRDWTQAAFTVDAVDSTGAGDAFCGALAAALAGRLDLPAAVRRAAAAGALATTVRGAVPSLPTGDQIDSLLAH